MQTTQSEGDAPADISIVPGEIADISVYYYPDANSPYKFLINLTISEGNPPKQIGFGTANVDIAKKLGDAFWTLRAANLPVH
jgi:hypothetical protein